MTAICQWTMTVYDLSATTNFHLHTSTTSFFPTADALQTSKITRQISDRGHVLKQQK